jgi:hypothetical protein
MFRKLVTDGERIRGL